MVLEEPEEGKIRYPTENELAETVAVMSVLATAGGPVSISEIATNFAQGKRVKKRVALTILALARVKGWATLLRPTEARASLYVAVLA